MSSITDSTKNRIKRRVKKNKSKGKSKSNAERGLADAKINMNNKRYKVRKRIKKNTDLTPKVARNYKIDAERYSRLPTYAYRPADSPSHILKSKNDLINLINSEIKQNNMAYGDYDEDVRKAQAELKASQDRVEYIKNLAREEINKRNAQKITEHNEELSFKKWEYEQDQDTKKKMADMTRNHNREKIKAEKALQKAQLEKDIQADKDSHRERMTTLKLETKKKNLQRMHDHNFAVYERNLKQLEYEGSYEPDGKTLKHGARKFAKDGIIFPKGTVEMKVDEYEREIKQIEREYEQKSMAIQQELDKINTRARLEDAPEYKKLLKEHAEAVKNAREAELNQQQAKRNKKLQQEIDALNYKIELIKAEDKVDEKLKQQLLQKQAELQTAKATHKLIRDQAKVERKLAEISAQRGEAERLQQLLNEHQQQVNELSLQNNNSREQLSQLKQTYSEYIPIARDIDAQTKAYQNEVAMAINRLTPHLTQQEQQSLKDITDPTLALQRMIELGQQRIANRGEYTGRALEVAENIRQVFQHDENLAKIGITLANVQQQLRNNQQEAAFATVPDFETAQVAAPPPEELERRFYTTFR